MEFWEILRGWMAVAIAAGSVIYTIYTARGRATKEAQAAQDERITEVTGGLRKDINGLTSSRSHDLEIHSQAFEQLRGRCQGLEDAMRHVPSKDEFHELALSVRDMSGEIGRLAEGLKPLGRSVERIDDFLMGQGPVHGQQRKG